jgi:hypothetical protein
VSFPLSLLLLPLDLESTAEIRSHTRNGISH